MKKIESVEFRKELERLLNRHSIDNECRTHDFVLAYFVVDCLKAYADALEERTRLTTRDVPVESAAKKSLGGEA